MYNDRNILGLTIETAKEEIEKYGLYIEEFTRDPDTILFPLNYEPKRINVRITHGIITEIVGRG